MQSIVRQSRPFHPRAHSQRAARRAVLLGGAKASFAIFTGAAARSYCWHVPWAEQGGVQSGTSQRSPVHPASHEHARPLGTSATASVGGRFPLAPASRCAYGAQWPCEEQSAHCRREQSTPVQFGWQTHCPATQNPR